MIAGDRHLVTHRFQAMHALHGNKGFTSGIIHGEQLDPAVTGCGTHHDASSLLSDTNSLHRTVA